MLNDPHTHLHLHRLTVDDVVARRRYRLDHPPQGRQPMRRLWAALRRRRVQPTAAPARPIAIAPDVAGDAGSRIRTTRSAPHAA